MADPRSISKLSALSSLGALAHEARLDVFRLLVRAGPEGLSAGEIARTMGVVQSTLSASLGILSRAGLVTARREGRFIIYAAAFVRMRELIAFLMEDCCAGKAEILGAPASGGDEHTAAREGSQ